MCTLNPKVHIPAADRFLFERLVRLTAISGAILTKSAGAGTGANLLNFSPNQLAALAGLYLGRAHWLLVQANHVFFCRGLYPYFQHSRIPHDRRRTLLQGEKLYRV
jgi:hypothetical protein